MSYHDNKGRFVKGNKASTGNRTPKELRDLRKETSEAIIRCAHSLTKPWSTLKEELSKKNASRLEVMLGHALSKKELKFIQWLVEMSIGKPRQVIAGDDDGENSINISYNIVDKNGSNKPS